MKCKDCKHAQDTGKVKLICRWGDGQLRVPFWADGEIHYVLKEYDYGCECFAPKETDHA